MLAVLTRDQLAHAMFPLGDTTKDRVRAEAAQRGLGVADKPDSHDVCFIADGDTRGFLARQLGEAPGPIVDSSGAAVGTHDGAYAFTVGQRRGLHLDHPAADGRPRYVLSIEPVTRTVTVGPAEELEIRDITAQRPVWTGCAPLTEARACAVQLRAHGEVYPCQARLDGGALQITLREPARGVASRPDRRPLRRRHRPGQRHHHRHPGTGQLLGALGSGGTFPASISNWLRSPG